MVKDNQLGDEITAYVKHPEVSVASATRHLRNKNKTETVEQYINCLHQNNITRELARNSEYWPYPQAIK